MAWQTCALGATARSQGNRIEVVAATSAHLLALHPIRAPSKVLDAQALRQIGGVEGPRIGVLLQTAVSHAGPPLG